MVYFTSKDIPILQELRLAKEEKISLLLGLLIFFSFASRIQGVYINLGI